MLALPMPVTAGLRTSGIRQKPVQEAMVIAAVVILLLHWLLWPLAAVVRWHFGIQAEPVPGGALRWAGRVASLSYFSAAGIFAYFFSLASEDLGRINTGLDPLMRLMQCLVVVGMAGTVLALWHAGRVWRAPVWWWTRLQTTLVALAGAVLGWFALYWNVVQTSLRF
jgi:hypothetical protein